MYLTLPNCVSTSSGYHILTPTKRYTTPTVKSIISTTLKSHDVSNKPSVPTPFLKTKQPAFTTVAGSSPPNRYHPSSFKSNNGDHAQLVFLKVLALSDSLRKFSRSREVE
ncbi:unnamed protein product [Porites lobata]|uniref:Uncharacterized protein n=1 Tax=Porites lobata TaxID=104759 RepID=A0ABN8NMM0_9CNID|nr:unnamed protein product [Porites lobata]